MVKNHLKRYAAPTSWGILRKERKYIVRPSSGAHPMGMSMPLSVFLKKEKHAETTKEVKRILHTQKILVDGYRRKDHSFGVGLMDVISLADATHYVIGLDNKGRLTSEAVDKKATSQKVCKIVGKQKVKGGKTQLSLHDSKNVLVENGEHSVGDSIVLDLSDKKTIKSHHKLEKGAKILLTAGSHVGVSGTVDSIVDKKLIFNTGKEKFETLKAYAFVLPN